MASQHSFDRSTFSEMPAVFEPFESFDGSAALGDGLPPEDDPLFPADWDQETSPCGGNLQSSLLNWSHHEPKAEPPPYASHVTKNSLTPAQQERLRNIAMPQHLQYRIHRSPDTTSSKSLSISSPDTTERGNNRKRKSSLEADDEDEDDLSGLHPPMKKTAHNMIEKRYRTNLNDKIAALRDSVPSLRIMSKSARGEDTADDREDLQGLTPAHKLNKATVLSKATEYINHLEKRNKRLQDENEAQKARLAAFEALFRSGSMGLRPTPINNPFQYQSNVSASGPLPYGDPQGLIPVPEDMRELHGQVSQQIYQVPHNNYQQHGRPNGNNGNNGGGYFGRLMIGSLAGLMVMEGFSEAEQEEDSPNARGLFAFPAQSLGKLNSAFHSLIDFNIFGFHVSAAQTVESLKLCLLIGTLLYVFLPTFFDQKPKSKGGKVKDASLIAAPSLASSIQVRRQAWLTAIQTVWVPRHNFFLEAAALCLKMVKLSMRNVIGHQGFTYITGVTKQQEAARIKAWTIALDAQLAGGDVEISTSRLTLTLLASGTLPDTPARLMLKALHIRVILWEVGNAGFNGFYMFREVAAKIARMKWNEAKQLRHFFAISGVEQDEEMPEHLATLLDQDCDDVLTDSIGQRAYNLAWNLPTSHNSQGSGDAIDGVVDDFAVRSPLDAVAAWYSNLVLQRALAKSLGFGSTSLEETATTSESVLEDIALAIKTAPIGSGSQIRALVARAVLVKEKRGFNIASSLQALGPLEKPGSGERNNFINTSTSITSLPDVKMSLHCAMALAHLERFPAPQNPQQAQRIISAVVPHGISLLGFTAAFRLMEAIDRHSVVAGSCSNHLEILAGRLRIWVGGKEGQRCGLGIKQRRTLVERCLGVSKRAVGVVDAGYESMSEED